MKYSAICLKSQPKFCRPAPVRLLCLSHMSEINQTPYLFPMKCRYTERPGCSLVLGHKAFWTSDLSIILPGTFLFNARGLCLQMVTPANLPPLRHLWFFQPCSSVCRLKWVGISIQEVCLCQEPYNQQATCSATGWTFRKKVSVW